MKLAGLAVLSAIALAAGDAPRGAVADSPDLTIRTRTVLAGVPGQTRITVRLKGARQWREHARDTGRAPAGGFSQIIQCDRRRALVLNPDTRTYAEMPIEPPALGIVHAALGALRGRDEADAPVTERITIDAVDTGERRRFGPLTARRVTTTTTTEMLHLSRRATRVQDGWYVDLPSPSCGDDDQEAFLIARVSRPGDPPGRMEVVHRGTARRGFAVIETDRTEAPDGAWTQSTELIEVSDRPIDASVFEVPPDYRPALRQWTGGFDFTRPDTAANRAVLLWEGARDLVFGLWR